MPTTPTTDAVDPDTVQQDRDQGEQLELFPQIMIYLTVKLDGSRGWSNTIAVQTPLGTDVIRRWGRQGGSIPHGATKCADDLAEAYEIAQAALSPFS